MAKIKWKSKAETERELKEQEAAQLPTIEDRVVRAEETTATLQETMDVIFGGCLMTTERLNEIKTVQEDLNKALAGKPFKNLSTGQKDKLLEAMAKILGLIN